MGRLIVKETPVVMGETTERQRKDFYYDGVRRIQETIVRGDLAPLIVEGANDEGAFDPGDPLNPNSSTQPPGQATYYWTDREYVYGPEYVDEFVCQFAETQPGTMYMLQDANYNVVALTNGVGTLLEQISYDPYGTVNAVDVFLPHVANRVGHQGLFFERYNGSFNEPTIAANIAGLYYNRNRYYSPNLGRFITRDPNETGIPILTAMAMNGESATILLRGFAGQSLYGDGMNLYQYLNSSPTNSYDPLGTTNLGELLVASLIQSTLTAIFGGAAGAGFSYACGGSDEDIFMGGLSGFTGGFGGGATAFAFSGAGLFVTLAASGAADGFISGLTQHYGMDRFDLKQSLANAVAGAAISVATGGILDGLGGVARSGMWGSWALLPKVVRNGRLYAQIGDYLYTSHAVDMMKPSGLGAAAGHDVAGRGIPPSVVESVIEGGEVIWSKGSRVQKYANGISVWTDDQVIVVTVRKGK